MIEKILLYYFIGHTFLKMIKKNNFVLFSSQSILSQAFTKRRMLIIQYGIFPSKLTEGIGGLRKKAKKTNLLTLKRLSLCWFLWTQISGKFLP